MIRSAVGLTIAAIGVAFLKAGDTLATVGINIECKEKK